MKLYTLTQVEGVDKSVKADSETGVQVFRVQRLRTQAEYSPSAQLKDAIKNASPALKTQLMSLLVK